MRISTSMRWLVVAVSAAMLLAVAAACSSETIEVPGETVVVEKEVIKTVEVPGETVTKEVVKEVMVPGETVVVEKEVIKTVEVPGQTVTVEVVKTVEVPGETVVVEKEVVKTVEVVKEVVKEVPGQKYVTDPTTGKTVSAPQYGGTLTVGESEGFTDRSSDPYFDFAGNYISGVNEKLGITNWGIDRDVFDFKSIFVPVSFMTGRLAESWDISPDGLTYTFNIRKGVNWQNKAPMNGRELTAQDVEYNWHRMLGMGKFAAAGASPFSRGTANLLSVPFESITATDKWTVVVKLTKPSLAGLRIILDNLMLWILPPEVIEQYGDYRDWRNTVGTGPFMLTDVVVGSSMTWTKNPDYWGYDEKYPENRLPYVDEHKVLEIPEEATKMAALRSGKIDFRRWTISLDSVLSLQRTNPEIAVHTVWMRSSDSFSPNFSVPPFNDINVRRAMQLALDNETIAATLWKGYADPVPHGMVGVTGYMVPFDEWPAEVKQYYRYDPEAAEKLLDEAGLPRGADGTRFKTVLNTSPSHNLEFSQIAAAFWAVIGVDVKIVEFPYVEYSEAFGARAYELTSSIAGAVYDPVMMVGWFQSGTHMNTSAVPDPEMDAMIDAALAATTIEEQKRLIAEADMYFIEQHRHIWGPRSPSYYFAQPWLIGYNGELQLSENEFLPLVARLWIDSELKEAMGH